MNASTTPIPTLEESNQDADKSLQMVGFRLGNEEYGVEINKVREIILVGEITQVPETPPFVKGLINLRSTVIPIIDLKLRFGLKEMPRTDETRIVVLNVAGKTIGIIVDAVNEVIRISADQIAPPPPAVAGLDQEHLVGLAKLEDRLLILLDIENILNDETATETENASISIN